MQRNILTVPVRRVGDQTVTEQDWVAVEEPLEIRICGRNVAVTMRTPGHDDELAAGFLCTEGILQNAGQISEIAAPELNVIDVRTDAAIDLERLERHFYMSSSCGVCGKASIQSVESAGCALLDRERPMVEALVIHRLPEELRTRQAVFDRTGGLHASALFDATGKLLEVREDVGRHNALDKLIGKSFLAGELPLSGHVLLVSGRVSFELVQKAAMAGIAVLAAVGAPSSLAVEMALRFGMTLAGFVRNGRFNLYSGEWRVR
ncbi:MAG: formate dehydrogenase accessory sulfurtransferase FdhD [Acidobacteriia bacterium]|nr:formate dehydrogenase accessory sulfurtransferase FdhD [Terriglobia bacterium]